MHRAAWSIAPHERPEFYLADSGAMVWRAPAVVFNDAAYI